MATENASPRTGLATTASVDTALASGHSKAVSRAAAAVCVGLFGLGLVWAAGFANAAALHNAAHDSRHSLVFPCH